MNNEQEIEKMGKLLCDNYPQGCKDCWYDPCKDHEDSCAIESEVETLVSAGIGDKKQAVREFARKICDKAFFLRKTEIADENGEFVTVDEYVDNLCYNSFEELFGEKLCLYGDNNE